MKKTTKWILIGVAVAVALVIVFNLLPDGIRIASTVSVAAGFVAGVAARGWYDRKSQEKEDEA
jgi:hypothetical protein